MKLRQRVERLESVRKPRRRSALVIYDPKTGEALTPVPADAKALVWLPEKKTMQA